MASVPSFQRFASHDLYRKSSMTLLLPQLATKWAPCACVCFAPVRASGQSSQKVEKSNRRSKFGESILVYPYEEDDLPAPAGAAGLLKEYQLGTTQESATLPLVPHPKKRRPPVTNFSHTSDLTPARLAANCENSQMQLQVDSSVASRSEPMSVEVRDLDTDDWKVHGFEMGNENDESDDWASHTEPLADVAVPSRRLSAREWEEKARRMLRKQRLRRTVPGTPSALPDTAKPAGSEGKRRKQKKAADDHSEAEPCPLGLSPGERELVRGLGLERYSALARFLFSIGLSKGDMARVAAKRKSSLRTNLANAELRVAYVCSLGVSKKDLAKLLVRHPQILEYSIERTMAPRVAYLRSLGVAEKELGCMITREPSLLECSVERAFKPRVRYLTESVGIREKDMAAVVRRSPQILTQSIEGSLAPRVAFLRSLGIDFLGLAHMVTRHPQLLHYSVESGMRPRIAFLNSLGLSKKELAHILVRLSQILSLSVEDNLRPKYEYLVTHLGGNAATIAKFPAYLSLSLDQRIRPRHQFIAARNKLRGTVFPMKWMAMTDADFCAATECGLEDYESFKHSVLLEKVADKFGKGGSRGSSSSSGHARSGTRTAPPKVQKGNEHGAQPLHTESVT